MPVLRTLLLLALLAPSTSCQTTARTDAGASALDVFAYLGALAEGDAVLVDGEYADVYTLTVPPGTPTLMISMTSGEIDSYLMARGPGGEIENNDDTSQSTLDATLIVFGPAAGEWRITATSARSGETGTYELVFGAGAGGDLLARIGALTPDDYRDVTGAAPAPSRAPGTPSAEPATVLVANQSGTEIRNLYASACSDGGWGEDRLAQVLAAGYSFTLSLTPGCWDVRAVLADGQEVTYTDWTLTPGPAVWTVASR